MWRLQKIRGVNFLSKPTTWATKISAPGNQGEARQDEPHSKRARMGWGAVKARNPEEIVHPFQRKQGFQRWRKDDLDIVHR